MTKGILPCVHTVGPSGSVVMCSKSGESKESCKNKAKPSGQRSEDVVQIHIEASVFLSVWLQYKLSMYRSCMRPKSMLVKSF